VDGYGVVIVSKDVSDRIIVSFSYDLQLVAKVKTIEDRKWHPDKGFLAYLSEVGYPKQVRIQSTLGRTKSGIDSLVNKLDEIAALRKSKNINV
jgi:hypothetical protein